MPDENPTQSVAERYDALERAVLYLLTNGLPIWSVEDLGRDLDDPAGAEDAVRGLRGAGLIHQPRTGSCSLRVRASGWSRSSGRWPSYEVFVLLQRPSHP
jgi:hypothetical protein